MTPDKPSDPTIQYLDVNGLRLAYTIEGKGAQTLIAIPGLPGSIRDFRWLAPALPDSVRLVRVELPGFGSSERRGYRGMSLEQRAQSILPLISMLELESVVLLSHSSGSTVSAELAKTHPNLVKKAIYISPAGPKAHYPVGLVRCVGVLMAWKLTRMIMFPTNRFFFGQLGFPKYLSDHERCYATLDAGATDFKTHQKNLMAQTQPALVAWGLQDKISPPKFTKPLGEHLPPGPRLEFDDGGHTIQKSHAVEIGAAIKNFLNED